MQLGEEKDRVGGKISKTDDFLRTIIDGIREDILVIDQDLKIIEVNQSYLDRRDLKRDNVIGKYCFSLFKSLGELCLLEEGECPLDSMSWGKPFHSMRKFEDKEGNLRYHEVSVYPIRDYNKQITHSIKITRDVTETKVLQKRLRESEEKYRKHVSRELHDGIGQALNAMALYFCLAKDGLAESPQKALEHLSKAESLLRHITDEVHGLALSLRPSALDDLGLISALRSLCDDFATRTGIAVDLKTGSINNFEDFEDFKDKEIGTALYRITQEGLCNVEKHAQATHVLIKLDRTDSRIVLLIKDNGSGFEFRGASRKGLGLVGMQERVSLLGGNININSKENRGTEVKIEISLKGLG